MQCKNRVIRTGVTTAMLLTLGGLVSGYAQAGEVEQAQEYRQGAMNVFKWNMKAMSDMMKGKSTYDEAAFARHANDLAKATTLDVLSGFPADSDGGDSDARPDIWLNFKDFTHKLEDLRAAAQGLSKIANSGDKQAMGEALGKTGKACKACHDDYKD
jgi:cytochrome c556